MKTGIHTRRAELRPRAGAARRVLGLAAIAFFSMGGFACLGGSSDPGIGLANDPERRALRIEELRQAIARDHSTLEDLISRPRGADEIRLYVDPELRTIATRLTEQERELERLESPLAAAAPAR
jgi:hypothetical protein